MKRFILVYHLDNTDIHHRHYRKVVIHEIFQVIFRFVFIHDLLWIDLDSCLNRPNAPKDIQVVIRKGDHNGINSLVTNMSLQQFRQMIGLQCSTSMTATQANDRRVPPLIRTSDTRRPYSSMNANTNQPSSSSSSSSSSSLTTSNIRLVNGLKQQQQQRTQETLLQQNYSSLPISSREFILDNQNFSFSRYSRWNSINEFSWC